MCKKKNRVSDAILRFANKRPKFPKNENQTLQKRGFYENIRS